MSAPAVSIVIRTKNEESWIAHCLKMVFKQRFADFEVIVVDNESTDHTVNMARRFPVKEVVAIDRYLPGLALNMGIERAAGSRIVCLSAHCIPLDENWLGNLLAGFTDSTIAGVYGRQLPLPFTTAIDRRDLLTVFGRDRRIQTKDYFFHNANSVVRRDVLDAHPFDATLTNLEDRHWAKRVIEAGYRLAYEPEAAVYHHHGLNHDNDAARAEGVSSVLETVAEDIARELPESLKPENSNVVAIVPVLGEVRRLQGRNLLEDLLDELARARYVHGVYVLSERDDVRALAAGRGAGFLARPADLLAPEVTLGDVLRHALVQVEAAGVYPEAIVSANYLFPYRPPNLFDELVVECRYKGLDTVFAGFVDYNDHWLTSPDGQIRRATEAFRRLADKPQLYRSLYGLGCVTQSSVIRRGHLVGSKVGIVPIEDHVYTLRSTERRRETMPPLGTEPRSEDERLVELFLREFRP